MNNSGRLENLKGMLEKEPEDVFLNYALGIEYVSHSDKINDAEKQFKLVLQLNPDYIAAYYQLGKLFESIQRISEALKYYKTGLEKAGDQKNNKAINEFNEAIFMLED